MHLIWVVLTLTIVQMQDQQAISQRFLKRRQLASLVQVKPGAGQQGKQDTITTSGTTCGSRRQQ